VKALPRTSERTKGLSPPTLELRVLLQVDNVTICYGKSLAVTDLSIEVPDGSVVNLIGANGSGKSTTLRAIAGIKDISEGTICFNGKRIDNLEAQDIVREGLVLVPEGRQLFPFLTVQANLELGASLRRDKAGIRASLEEVFEYFPRLKERMKQRAGTLSGGEQQMLAIGRGLMAAPKLLCLDEPSLGLAPIMVEMIGRVIRDLNARGVTILLAEQNVHLALAVADKGYALQVGRVVLEGDIDTMRNSEAVKRAYLGG
jgi:branched-chain amino acid transport system ATP-binding protein